MFSRLSLAAAAALLAACADKDLPIEPSLGAGKADVADRVELRGPLHFDDAVAGSMTEDLEFHGYVLAAAGGSVVTVEVTQKGTTRALDTTMFVYGPREAAGGFGTEAIAFDDDSGWGRFPRLRDLELAAAGDYLIVVGTHDGRGRGNYRLEARCPAGDCQPDPGALCHPVLADDIRACIEDTLADPEAEVSEIEALEMCLVGELFGAAFDEICATAPEPFCDQPFEDFFLAQEPVCRDEIAAEIEGT